MEDETGIANVVIHPDLYERQRVLVTRGKFLKVFGRLQNQDGIVHVKAERLEELASAKIPVSSHDFY
jgi:error-prone DNA polymerase